MNIRDGLQRALKMSLKKRQRMTDVVIIPTEIPPNPTKVIVKYEELLTKLQAYREVDLSQVEIIDYYCPRLDADFNATIIENASFLHEVVQLGKIKILSYRHTTNSTEVTEGVCKLFPNSLFFKINLVSLTIWYGKATTDYLRKLWRAISEMINLNIFCIQIERNGESPVLTPEIASKVLNNVKDIEFGKHCDIDHACFSMTRGIFNKQRFSQHSLRTQNQVFLKMAVTHLLNHIGAFDCSYIAYAQGTNNILGLAKYIFEDIYNQTLQDYAT